MGALRRGGHEAGGQKFGAVAVGSSRVVGAGPKETLGIFEQGPERAEGCALQAPGGGGFQKRGVQRPWGGPMGGRAVLAP